MAQPPPARIAASTRHHPMLSAIPALPLAGSPARRRGDRVQVPGQPGEAPPGGPYRQQRDRHPQVTWWLGQSRRIRAGVSHT
jgi:hypothetical protein